MKKLPLCLTAVICFSLLNVATANELERYLQRCNEENNGSLCHLVGFLYQDEQNYPLVKQYYEKSCDLNFGEGCNALGTLYNKGLGVRQNSQTAKEYYGKACDLGEQAGCNKYRELNEKGY